MKKFILTLVAVLTIFASTAEARGPHAYNRGRNHYQAPRKQVVIVNNHYHRPHYNHGYHYSSGYYHHNSRDAARVGAVVLGVGALALAVSSF